MIFLHKQNLASGVEMALLMRILYVAISDMGFVTSPGFSIIFLPAVSLVQLVSSFYGFKSQTILPYITFRYFRTFDFGMKKILFDAETLLPTL